MLERYPDQHRQAPAQVDRHVAGAYRRRVQADFYVWLFTIDGEIQPEYGGRDVLTGVHNGDVA